jgi:hypothetical protein
VWLEFEEEGYKGKGFFLKIYMKIKKLKIGVEKCNFLQWR